MPADSNMWEILFYCLIVSTLRDILSLLTTYWYYSLPTFVFYVLIKLREPIFGYLNPGRWLRRKKGPVFRVGRTDYGRPFELTLQQLNHHIHVLGESGFGKTVFLTHLIEQQIKAGLGFVLIDLKGEKELLDRVIARCHESNRQNDLKILCCDRPEISSTYNVLRHGNPTELKDKIIGAFEWTEPYYKKVAEETVLNLFKQPSKQKPDLRQIHQALERVSKTTSSAQKDLAGLKADLSLLVQSEFGGLLREDENGIDLFEAMQKNQIVVISLAGLQYSETSIRLGKMILQDLKTASAKVFREIPRPDRKPFTVFIDEFAEIASPQFTSFIRMARGSGVGIVMAHQEYADLDAISPNFRNQVMGNAATTVSFLQKNPQSAELIGLLAGTRKGKKVTEQVETGFFSEGPTGMKSVREVEEFLIHPNEIKNLRVGECVVISKYPKARIAKATVSAPTRPQQKRTKIPNEQHIKTQPTALIRQTHFDSEGRDLADCF